MIAKLTSMKKFLMKHINEQKEFGSVYEKYFILHKDTETRAFVHPEEWREVTEDELNHCGYFVIVTSNK